jgi:hypothetical protein
VRALLSLVDPKPRDGLLDCCVQKAENFHARMRHFVDIGAPHQAHPSGVSGGDAQHTVAAEDALFFADTGTAIIWVARMIEYGPNRRLWTRSGGRIRAAKGLVGSGVRGGTESFFPPLDWDDPQGQLKGSPIEGFRELGDHDDSVGQPINAALTLDLYGRAAASPPLPADVVGRVRGVQEPADPGELARQLDVAVNNLGVDLGVEHHGGPSAEYLVGLLDKEGDLLVQPGMAIVVSDDPTHGGGQPRGVPNNLGARVDGLLLTCVAQ